MDNVNLIDRIKKGERLCYYKLSPTCIKIGSHKLITNWGICNKCLMIITNKRYKKKYKKMMELIKIESESSEESDYNTDDEIN